MSKKEIPETTDTLRFIRGCAIGIEGLNCHEWWHTITDILNECKSIIPQIFNEKLVEIDDTLLNYVIPGSFPKEKRITNKDNVELIGSIGGIDKANVICGDQKSINPITKVFFHKKIADKNKKGLYHEKYLAINAAGEFMIIDIWFRYETINTQDKTTKSPPPANQIVEKCEVRCATETMKNDVIMLLNDYNLVRTIFDICFRQIEEAIDEKQNELKEWKDKTQTFFKTKKCINY